MAVYRPIKEKRQTPNARTTKTAHTSGCITYGYINNPTRIRLICYLQSTLCWIQGQSLYILKTKTGYKWY